MFYISIFEFIIINQLTQKETLARAKLDFVGVSWEQTQSKGQTKMIWSLWTTSRSICFHFEKESSIHNTPRLSFQSCSIN